MLFRQILQEDLSCASYLVGDTSAGVAAVIDPQWDIDPYLRLSRLHGVRIEHVLETHNHADHVSGHGRLARATGATIHIHELAEAEYEHEAFGDGWKLELGDVVIQAMHTPGHRPEHTAFVLYARDRGEEPWAIMTGDSLFVGDVVGVVVRLQHVLDLDPVQPCQPPVGLDVPLRIDDHRHPRFPVGDQIGRTAEVLVDDLAEEHRLAIRLARKQGPGAHS